MTSTTEQLEYFKKALLRAENRAKLYEHGYRELLAKAAAAKAIEEQAKVKWSVDWGKDGNRSCVSIYKLYPNGAIEIVATEFEPEEMKGI